MAIIKSNFGNGSTEAVKHFLKPTVKIERQVWRKFWTCKAAFADRHEYPLLGSAAVQRLYVAGHPAPIKFPLSQPIPPILGCMRRQPLIAKPSNTSGALKLKESCAPPTPFIEF
jgi:hypothetical protein